MSRNKDIYALHVITGNSYKECRNRMKAAHWNLYIALGYQADWDAIAEVLKDVAECIGKTITEAVKQLQQTLNDLDPAEIRRILAEAESEAQDE